MTNPRMTHDYSNIGQRRVTYQIDDDTIQFSRDAAHGSAGVGLAVTLSGDNEVALAGDGEAVLGRLEKVEADGSAVVTEIGHVKLPAGDGATLTLGSKIVGDLNGDGDPGYIRAVASATAEELAVARGIIRENTDTDAVGVIL